jgi:hypothetical protein
MDPQALWDFLVTGYLFSVAIEAPILLVGLSRHHSLGRRLFAGFWLTACTYPIVVLVLPLLLDAENARGLYLLVAETFAPVAECVLFWAAFGEGKPGATWRDYAVITLANVASFTLGELVHPNSREWWVQILGG